MKDKPNSANPQGVFEPFSISAVPWEEFTRGSRFGMRYQHLSSFGGGTQISISNEILEPGRQAKPTHYHMVEEEHVLVLEGALTLRLGEKTHLMKAADYVCFPAGQKLGHALINHTTAPCRYLIIGNPQPHDVAVHTDTGRVSVKLMGEGYDQAAPMEYWQGVDVDAK